MTRLDALLLPVDPGRSSGLALLDASRLGSAPRRGASRAPAELVAAEPVSTWAARELWIRAAQAQARKRGIPLIPILETWSTFRGLSMPAILSMTESRGAWLHALERAGIPREDVLDVIPQTWRPHIIRGLRPYPRTEKELKAAVAAWAARVWGIQKAPHDVTDALGMGSWALHAPEVREHLTHLLARAA